MLDHEDEIRVLSGYIENNGLERMIKEVAELVRQDVNEEAAESGDGDDVNM